MGDQQPPRLSTLDVFCRLHPELESKGIAIIIGKYNPESRLNDGYFGEIPPGFKIKHLGHIPGAKIPDYDEFALWDPSKIEVNIHREFGTSGRLRRLASERAITKAALWQMDGFNVEERPYNDAIVLLAQRPVIATASLADGTSQPTQ